MIFLRLFFEFARVGLFAVGGGLATIPFLQELTAQGKGNEHCRRHSQTSGGDEGSGGRPQALKYGVHCFGLEF